MQLIDQLVAQNENLVIEGVHLTVDFMLNVMRKYPFCVPFVVFIKNKEKHKERFAVRSKQMTLDPRYNRYVECFHTIRQIHKSFVRKAEISLIPRIDNTNVDKSLGLIHSTLVRCLRQIVKGEPLLDEATNKAGPLCQEFNIVSKSGLSSAEAQKVIKSKVYKGEIFARFFGSMPPEEPPRSHSFDEKEAEQLRKEAEAEAQQLRKQAEAEAAAEAEAEAEHKADDVSPEYPKEALKVGVHESGLLRLLEAQKNEGLPSDRPSGAPVGDPSREAEAGRNNPESTQPAEASEVPGLHKTDDLAMPEKPLKTSKSSENLREEAKKKKNVRFNLTAQHKLIQKRPRPPDESPMDEDKQVRRWHFK